MQASSIKTRRDPWIWWRAVGWPLLWMPLLVILTVTVLDQQLRTGFAREPLRLAVFTEAPAPGLLDWLAGQPDVQLRTDVEPMAFRGLVGADSLDAAWIVPEDFATAVDNRQTATIQQYSDPQRTRTDIRLDRLLQRYRNQVLEARAQAAGLPNQLLYPLEVRPVSVSGGLGAVATTVTAIARGLGLLLALAVSLYVAALVAPGGGYALRQEPAWHWPLRAAAWGTLALGLSTFGWWLGCALMGSSATLLRNVLSVLWQPVPLLGGLAGGALYLLLVSALGTWLARRCGSYRAARGALRGVLVIGMGLVVWWLG